MADPFITSYVTGVYSALASQQTQMSALAQTNIARGSDLYLSGNYDGAAQSFKSALALDVSQDNVIKVNQLLAAVYLKQGKLDDAAKAYKTSIAMAPADDTAHLSLGNISFSQGNYADAEKEYKLAVRLNPTSADNQYSLGQVYLTTGRYGEAEQIFKQVIRLDPSSYGGYYALGQTYSKEGRTQEAIDEFRKVVGMNRSFAEVHVDLGSAYADLGQLDKAQEELSILQKDDANLASLLSAYIDKATKPKITSVDRSLFFPFGPGTQLSSLNPNLSDPYSSFSFSMVFVFDKEMDPASVQDISNWSIAKAPEGARGGAYLPMTNDAPLPPLPLNVVYIQATKSALVNFTVSQNGGGDATIDPLNVMFAFKGKDAYGNAMDPAADQFTGTSILA